MAKVGRTSRAPIERMSELSAASGVATPFVLVFDHAFDDCITAERLVHDELDRRCLRVANNREFFRGSVADIIRVVLDVAARLGPPAAVQAEDQAAALLRAGDDHMLGRGEALQDVGEALRLYRLAAQAGSLVAYERLGSLHLRFRDRGPLNRRRALGYFREGADRGNYYCYCELALVYGDERHEANYAKCWAMFFAAYSGGRREELEVGGRYVVACRQYLSTTLEQGWTPTHVDHLMPLADAILDGLAASLADTGLTEDRRQLLSTVRDWAERTLKPTRVAAGRPEVVLATRGYGLSEARRYGFSETRAPEAAFGHLPELFGSAARESRGPFVPEAELRETPHTAGAAMARTFASLFGAGVRRMSAGA